MQLFGRAMVLVLLALAVFALPVAAQESVTIPLRDQSGSGQSGTAVLTAMGNQTRVVVTLSNPPAGVAQPAHIHEGTRANLNPKPRYPLQSLMDGRSETVVDVPLTDLLAGQLAINVHKSQQEISTYVACGEIRAQVAPATGAGPHALPGWSIAAALLSGPLFVTRGSVCGWSDARRGSVMRRSWPIVAVLAVLLVAGCGGRPNSGTTPGRASGSGYSGPHDYGLGYATSVPTPAAAASPSAPQALSPAPGAAAPTAIPTVAEGGTVEIAVVNFGFQPAEVTVAAGTTVVWRNVSPTTHTVAAKNRSFESEFIEPGGSYSVTLREPGVYDYECTLHPEMVGRIIVR
jgi:plastocyanin